MLNHSGDASDRPLIMGILNVTPDSFSDGGRYPDVARALAHALEMARDGADIIDVGGESSRPGAGAVAEQTQLARVVPVVERLREALPGHVRISIDTRSPTVAAAALRAGAGMVNDISAAQAPGMLELVAAAGVPVVLMHMQGSPETMQTAPHYDDVVQDIRRFLLDAAARAAEHGVPTANIILDPGIGFGKTREHNLTLLANLEVFAATGYAVLLGASRKRFMGALCREQVFNELVGATCATTVIGVQAGVRLFRVHDVKANRQALEVAWATLRDNANPSAL